jgi:uncharacterized protein
VVCGHYVALLAIGSGAFKRWASAKIVHLLGAVMTTLWLDADACPKLIREICFRAAERCQVHLYLVANQPIPHPPSPWLHKLVVSSGFDVADNTIVERAQAGDIAVTADIPLAAELMAKQVAVINPRGEAYNADTIRQRLNMRDFMDSLRGSGVQSGGPPPLGETERRAFANALDRLLAQRRR